MGKCNWPALADVLERHGVFPGCPDSREELAKLLEQDGVCDETLEAVAQQAALEAASAEAAASILASWVRDANLPMLLAEKAAHRERFAAFKADQAAKAVKAANPYPNFATETAEQQFDRQWGLTIASLRASRAAGTISVNDGELLDQLLEDRKRHYREEAPDDD